jgi:Na+-transporting methylmalonyl-CoA/oxaloacetate decarboxylase gamma subunit
VTTQTPAQTTQPEQKQTASVKKTGSSSKLPLIIGLVLLLLLLLGLIIYFLSRKSGSSPSRVTKDAAPPKRDEEKPKVVDRDMTKYAAVQPKQRTTPYADRPVKTEKDNPLVINPTGPLLLNLFVEDQNTNIGKRNIHSLKSGYSLSVGGGNSDFLIFLVPIPAGIGELRRNASQLTFIPRKHKYFPDLGSSELRDCLNKTIRIISDRGYEIRFRFEMYEDPLTALNRILNQIKVPG